LELIIFSSWIVREFFNIVNRNGRKVSTSTSCTEGGIINGLGGVRRRLSTRHRRLWMTVAVKSALEDREGYQAGTIEKTTGDDDFSWEQILGADRPFRGRYMDAPEKTKGVGSRQRTDNIPSCEPVPARRGEKSGHEF
jgi:hypothetical protein